MWTRRRGTGSRRGPRVWAAEELWRWSRPTGRRLGGRATTLEEDGGPAAGRRSSGSGGGGRRQVTRWRRPTDGGRVEASRGGDLPVDGRGELFYCPMCMELVPINLKSSLGPCGHAFCSSCVTMYVAAKQEQREDVGRVKCPDCDDGVPVLDTDGIQHSPVGMLRFTEADGNGDLPADGHGEPFDCAICMETVPGALKFSVGPCGHAFCRSSVAQYVAAKLDEEAARVECPHPGCVAGTVEPERCRGVIPPDLLHRWGFLLCELAVGAMSVYCPYRECSAPLLADAKAIAEAECAHCHRLFCARCAVP
ncbi:hypothetical protein ZWY2020_009712 [Hordeum vulgare]|nr:hypothetical protein ZWY2020_009712 [Hordeum vulgare]